VSCSTEVTLTLLSLSEQVKSYMAQHSAKGCLDTTCKGILHDIPDDLVFHNEQYTYGHLVVVRDGMVQLLL